MFKAFTLCHKYVHVIQVFFNLSKLYIQCGAQIHDPRSRAAHSSTWASQAPRCIYVLKI